MTDRTAAPFSTIFPPQLLRYAPYYLLALAVFCAYADVYDNALLYDDLYLIQKNEYLQSWHRLGDIFLTYVNSGAFRYGQFYRPLQNVLYLIVYQLCDGPSLFGFHLLNVSFHAGNACLMYALGCRLNFNPRAVFIATLVWALHPIHTEAVTYMSGTADLLYVFFSLLSLVILPPDFTTRKFLLVIPVFLLGLIGKETTIILPLLAMICMYLVLPDRLNIRIYLRTWPLWIVIVVYIIARGVFVPFHGDGLVNIDPTSQYYATHIGVRISTFLATVPAYFQLILWPVGLHMDRDFPAYLTPWFWDVWIGAALIIAAAAQTVWWGRGRRDLPLSWGLMWFTVTQIPQTGVLMAVNSLFLEHWMYMPTVGLFLGVAQFASTKLTHKDSGMAASIVMIFIALVFGQWTYEQNKIWCDPITFYTNILNHGETSARAHNNLGIAYMDKGDYDKAMEQFKLAMKDHDLTPETHQDIAALLSKNPDGRPHVQEEIAELKRALEIKPDFLPACTGLADLYDYMGDKDDAAIYRAKADAIRRKFMP